MRFNADHVEPPPQLRHSHPERVAFDKPLMSPSVNVCGTTQHDMQWSGTAMDGGGNSCCNKETDATYARPASSPKLLDKYSTERCSSDVQTPAVDFDNLTDLGHFGPDLAHIYQTRSDLASIVGRRAKSGSYRQAVYHTTRVDGRCRPNAWLPLRCTPPKKTLTPMATCLTG